MSEEFFKLVNKTESCWLWLGTVYDRYGIFYDARTQKQERAHRYSYRLHKGHISYRMDIHHKCDNKLCVNPDHLEMITRAQHNKITDNGFRSRKKCPKGHDLDYIRPDGRGRGCLICRHRQSRKHNRKIT